MSAIPTGNIQFLSNASSVCQVFGLGTANVSMSSLVGKKTKASEIAFSSNTTLALPISLRSLAGLWALNITQIPSEPIPILNIPSLSVSSNPIAGTAALPSPVLINLFTEAVPVVVIAPEVAFKLVTVVPPADKVLVILALPVTSRVCNGS